MANRRWHGRQRNNLENHLPNPLSAIAAMHTRHKAQLIYEIHSYDARRQEGQSGKRGIATHRHTRVCCAQINADDGPSDLVRALHNINTINVCDRRAGKDGACGWAGGGGMATAARTLVGLVDMAARRAEPGAVNANRCDDTEVAQMRDTVERNMAGEEVREANDTF